MEKHYEYAKDLHMVFVDYKQAYDSVNREKLWEALKTFGIPLKIIKMVQLCNSETYSKVKLGNEVSMAFEIKSGLRQGDAMSPILFNMALESVVREMSNGDAWSPHRGLLLAYADDIIITGNTRTEVQMNLKKLMKASKNMGLLVNEEKTKYMAITRRSEDSSNLKVENKEFEQVKEFKYLGVTLNNKNIMHEEINVRLNAANRCYFAMETIFKSKLISKNVKEKLYISYIRPVLTYACATWATTKGDEEKLSRFERKILRRIHGPVFNTETQQWELRSNAQLENLYKRENIIQYVKSIRMQWAGHAWRAEGCLIKEIMTWTPTGKRPRGRPRRRWIDSVNEIWNAVGQEVRTNWQIIAQDREKWEEIVLAVKILNGS